MDKPLRSSLSHIPTGPWAFDAEVVEVFDDMARRSIPLYEMTLDLVARLAVEHLREGDEVWDLGSATGAASFEVAQAYDRPAELKFYAVDNAPEMLVHTRARLGGRVTILEHDLGEGLPPVLRERRPKVILCLWTAMFIPIEKRARLFAECRERIAPRGRLYVAEKLRGQTAAHQEDLRQRYEGWKREQGYSAEAVETKARSLEGVLVSCDAPEMKAMLSREGWSVEEIIRYLGFAAWQCIPMGSGPRLEPP